MLKACMSCIFAKCPVGGSNSSLLYFQTKAIDLATVPVLTINREYCCESYYKDDRPQQANSPKKVT